MRFAALETAVLGQPEVSIGLIPGGSGTVRLPRLLGRGRALEVVLGGLDYRAELAERYGYVNRALPRAELDAFVSALALRIASFPAHAIQRAKRAVLQAERGVEDDLREEERLFLESARHVEAKLRMAAYIGAGGQERDVELALDSTGILLP
jgi:enoyl-CoA hydratase/carnithine racemase